MDHEIYRPYPEIKALLRLRGITLKRVAAEKEISYTILSKLLNGKTYRDSTGKEVKYDVPHIHQALAEYIEVSNENLWGPEGKDILARLIADEAVRMGKNKKADETRTKCRWNFKWFLHNLIKLGMRPSNEKDK